MKKTDDLVHVDLIGISSPNHHHILGGSSDESMKMSLWKFSRTKRGRLEGRHGINWDMNELIRHHVYGGRLRVAFCGINGQSIYLICHLPIENQGERKRDLEDKDEEGRRETHVCQVAVKY